MVILILMDKAEWREAGARGLAWGLGSNPDPEGCKLCDCDGHSTLLRDSRGKREALSLPGICEPDVMAMQPLMRCI